MSEIIDIKFVTNAPEYATESKRIEQAITGVERRTGAMSKETVESSRKMEESGKRVDGMYKQLGSTLAKLGGTIAIATLAKQLYDFANAFDKSMTEVATISATVTDNMESFTQQVLAMGTRVPIAADAAAKALYQIVSAGYDGAAGMNLLEVSAKSAIAGMTDTTTAADAITTSLNAYKKDAQEAAQVSDLLFMTAKLGKTTFGQLGQSISQAAPIAAAYGVELEQVLAAVATLTKSGTPTAQAMTQIRAAIIGVSKYLGDGAYDVMTFQEALDSIAQKAGGSEDALRSMITETEAISGVLGLTGINARMAADDLAAMGGAAGETEKAFAKMNDKVDNQMVILKNNMLKKFHEAGAGALDVVGDLTKFINNAFETGAIDNVIATMGVLIATLGVYKASILAANAVNTVGNSLKYTAEIAEMQKLLGVKEVSKLSDVEQLVMDSRITKSQADKVLAIRAQVQAKLDDLSATARMTKTEALNAAISHKAALQKALTSKSMVTQRQLELSLATLSGNASDIELAKTSLLEAQVDRHIAVKARKATADVLSVANSKAISAATAIETLQQNINTASTKAGAKAKGLMTVASASLTKAFNALKLAFATNPFGLAATAMVALITTMSLFKNKSDQTASSMKNASQEAGAESAKLSALEKVLKNSIIPYRDRKEALDKLKSIMPGYSASLTEEGRLIEDNTGALKQYIEQLKNTSLAKIAANKFMDAQSDLDSWIESIGDRGKEIIVNVGQWRFAVEQFGKDAAIQMGYKQDFAAERMYDELLETMSKKEDEIKKWEAKLEGYTTKSISSESDGDGGKEPSATPEMYGANYKAAQKEWETAKKELAAIEKDKNAFTQKQYDEAKKREMDAQAAFASKGGVTKGATAAKKDDKEAIDRQKNIDTAIDAEQELKERLVSIAFETQQAVIDTREAGFEREMAQIDLNYRKKQTEIEMWEREQHKMIIDAQEIDFVAKGGKREDFKPNYSDANFIPINKAYDAKTAVNGAEQANATKALLNGIRGQWQDWGDEYQQIEDKITETSKKAAKDRADVSAAVAGGKLTKDDGATATDTINKGENKAIADLNSSKTKLTASWSQVFRDLEGMSRAEVKVLIGEINEQLENEELAPADASALLEQMNKAKDFAIALNPFASLIEGLGAVKTATRELEDAKIALQKVTDNGGSDTERKAAEEAKKRAQEKVNRTKEERNASAQKGLSDISSVGGATSDLLKTFGVESPAVDGVVNSLSALGEINFSNPMSILTGGLKAVSSLLGGIFGEMDAVKERKIQEIQKQVDALDKSYEKLGEEIDKAYSTDAAKLIAQQDEMLKKQNELIEQQKREEESKKDSDDGRVNEYNDAIDENNKKLEENKQKKLDAINGTDVKSAIDDFANAYVDAWASGEDKAASMKDVVKRMVKSAVTELMKSRLSPEVNKFMEFLATAMEDGILTDVESKMLDQFETELYNKAEGIDKSFDKYIKDDTAKNESSLTGQIRGSVATEASVSELGGIFRGQLEKLSSIDTRLDLGFRGIAEMARLQAEIAVNTRRTADNTDGLGLRIDATNKKLDTVIKNTQKEYGKL